LYGAAEFSRDTDIVVLADDDNLNHVRAAMRELQAEVIAVPPFEGRYLQMGLAVHFRCRHPEAKGSRVDVMSRMRGVADFPVLWERRTTVTLGKEAIDVLALPDLVMAKKTQRDRDWPMISRLVQASYFAGRDAPTVQQVEFWLRELRTPALLVEAAATFPAECARLAAERPLLSLAEAGDAEALDRALRDEEQVEREADISYWAPLKAELRRLRQSRRS
jgi:hypothetical protein